MNIYQHHLNNYKYCLWDLTEWRLQKQEKFVFWPACCGKRQVSVWKRATDHPQSATRCWLNQTPASLNNTPPSGWCARAPTAQQISHVVKVTGEITKLHRTLSSSWKNYVYSELGSWALASAKKSAVVKPVHLLYAAHKHVQSLLADTEPWCFFLHSLRLELHWWIIY